MWGAIKIYRLCVSTYACVCVYLYSRGSMQIEGGKGGRNVRWLSVVIVTASNESNERAIYRCAQLPWEEPRAVVPPKPFHIDQPHHLSQGQPTKGISTPHSGRKKKKRVGSDVYGIVFKHAIVSRHDDGQAAECDERFMTCFHDRAKFDLFVSSPGVSPQTDTNTYGMEEKRKKKNNKIGGA